MQAEMEVQRTQKEAADHLPPMKDAFRRQVEAAESWLDFRLPAEGERLLSDHLTHYNSYIAFISFNLVPFLLPHRLYIV
jgi:hypothetical protein